MSSFTRRLTRDLHDIADHAEPLERVRAIDGGTAIEGTIPADTKSTPAVPNAIGLRMDKNDPPADAEIIFLDAAAPRRFGPGRLMVAAAAAALLVLVGGLVVIAHRATGDPATNEPVRAPAPTAVERTLPTVPAPSTPTPGWLDAASLPATGRFAEPGTYRTDLMGVPLTFELPATLGLWTAEPGRAAFSEADPASGAADAVPANTRDLEVLRLAEWNSPLPVDDPSVDDVVTEAAPIDPGDPEAWIAANNLPVDDTVTTTVAGHLTVRFDIRADAYSGIGVRDCPSARAPCFWYGTVSGARGAERDLTDPLLYAPAIHRFWVITIDGYDPLVIHAAAGLQDEAWLDEVASTTIATLELGPDGPPLIG